MTPIEQHHYDTITERIGVNRIKAEERAARGESPLDPPETTPEATAPPAPEPTFRDSVTKLAALGALLDEVKRAYAEARTDVQHHLDGQYKTSGTTKVDALLPGGTKVGSVSRTGGETAAQVVDDEAFAAWARDTFPSEHVVEIVPMQVRTSVRPAWQAQALAAMTAAGVPQYADPVTGVLHDVPGVAIRPSKAAGLRVTYTRRSKNSPVDGRELVAEAWRSGDLAAHVLPALAPAAPPPVEDEATAA